MSPKIAIRRFCIFSAVISAAGAAGWFCRPDRTSESPDSVVAVEQVCAARRGPGPVSTTRTPDCEFRRWIAELLAAEPSGERNRQLKTVVERWATEHPLDAIAYIESLQNEGSCRSLLEHAMSAWLRCMRAAALDYVFARARDDVGAREWCLGPALAALEESDGIESAIRFLADLPAEDSVYGPLVPVMARYIAGDPVGSAEMIDLLPLASSRDCFNEMRGAILATRQGWAALQTIAAESERADAHDRELIGAISMLSRSDPPRVLEWVAAQPDGTAMDVILSQLGHTLMAGDGDPSVAARLAVRIQDPTVGASLLPTALSRWYSKDPAAALAWAENQSLAPELVADAVIRGTPPTSAELRKALIQAECVADTKMRLRQQWLLAARWLRVDRDAALGWIRASTLPDEVKAMLDGDAIAGGR